MRKTAYGNILKGFQNFSVLDIKKDFAFHSIQDCFEFLKEQNAIYIQIINPTTQKTENQIDCKTSIIGSNCYFPPSSTFTTTSSSSSSTSFFLPSSKHDSKAHSSSRRANIISNITNNNSNGKKRQNGKNERNGKSEKNGKNGKHERSNRNVISGNRTVIQPSSSTTSTSTVFPHQINGLTSRSHLSLNSNNSNNTNSGSNDRRQVNLMTKNEVDDGSIVTKKKGGSKRGNIILFDDAKKDDNHTNLKMKQRKIELILT